MRAPAGGWAGHSGYISEAAGHISVARGDGPGYLRPRCEASVSARTQGKGPPACRSQLQAQAEPGDTGAGSWRWFAEQVVLPSAAQYIPTRGKPKGLLSKISERCPAVPRVAAGGWRDAVTVHLEAQTDSWIALVRSWTACVSLVFCSSDAVSLFSTSRICASWALICSS